MHQFKLDKSVGGSTQRQNLESVAKQTGKRPAELDGPPLPPVAERVWEWFLEIRSVAGGNGFGLNAIGHREIYYFEQVRKWPLYQWQVTALMKLDVAYRAENQPAPPPKTSDKPAANGRGKR